MSFHGHKRILVSPGYVRGQAEVIRSSVITYATNSGGRLIRRTEQLPTRQPINLSLKR